MIPSFTTYTSFYHHQSWSSSLNLHTALSRRWANCAADATKKYQRYEPHHHQKDGLTLIRHVNLSRGGGEAQKRRIDINAASATVTANSHDYGDEAHSPSSNLTSQTVGVSIHNNIKTNLQVMYIKYKNMIDKRPVLTKSISCGILSCIGDILSQWITFRSLLFVSSSSSAFYWNALQSWTFFITGCVFVGPYIHFWYQCLWILGQKLQNKYPILFSSKIKQMFVLNVLDQTLGVAIFFPMYFYFYEMILAACLWRVPNLTGATQHMMKELPSVLSMQYKIWPLANWINFMYVPESMRVLVSNIVAVIWNIYLCSKVSDVV